MKIIAQKSNILNTTDFIQNSLEKDYIDAISFNVAYTKDDRIVVFNNTSGDDAIKNTINNSTLGELEDYEVILLDNLLKNLSLQTTKKDIYINLVPSNPTLLSDDNIKQITADMNKYIDEIQTIINRYSNLKIYLHSSSSNLLTLLKQKIKNHKIGFAITSTNTNFIDVDYYVIIVSILNDAVVDILLKHKKEVIIYLYSDYYISYIYNHYLGKEATPQLKATFQQLKIISSYPEIIHKVF